MAKSKKSVSDDTSGEMLLASNDGFSGGSDINIPTIDKIPEEGMDDRSLNEGTNDNDLSPSLTVDPEPTNNIPLRSPTPTNDPPDNNTDNSTGTNSTPDEVNTEVVYSTFNSRILDGANPNDVEAPKEIIRQENSFYQFDWCWDKYAGATYAPGECCVKRITMPDGWVREDNMVDDFAPAAAPVAP